MGSLSAFVTGGTGFVGYSVVKALLDNGIKVRALVRPHAKEVLIFKLKLIGAQVVFGDILKPESYMGYLDGVSYVFHAAAMHTVWTKDPGLLYRTNVDAARDLLAAACQKKVEQFIYTSSIKSIGLPGDGSVADESMRCNTYEIDGHYGRSKFLAEDMLLKSTNDIAIKVLNPAAVIGPGDEKLTPTMDLIYRFMKGRIRFSLDTSMGLVDVRDVGRAHFLALAKARDRQRYILCAQNLSMDKLFYYIGRLSGVGVPRIHVPYGIAYAVSYLSSAASILTRQEPLVSTSSLNIARLKPAYSGEKAREELGIDYLPLEATLKDTLDWLKNVFSKDAR